MKSIIAAAVINLLLPLCAQAARYSYQGHIVHTHRAPVIVHKIFPPFTGIHVYDRWYFRRH